ncbi:DUF5684 domain-containing protein [Pedobacter sp. L105]|uniref:DUF5684 domain-containing protein n=1 Tax=Pedobacter sp. L105 TaxID=1641871 RepID=UPI00131CBCF2|nr:DUF5684 domain-containing protein [Pedobacter sp. L105]
MDYNSSSFSGIFALIGAIGIGTYLIFLVLMIASMWRLFEKAGKPGWASIIPIYNLIIMIEIVGKPTIWILWLIIPCVNFVFGIWLTNLFVKSFGKSEAYTIGMFILPFIFYPLLAFGNNPYLGPSAAEAKGYGPYNGYGSNNPLNQPPTPPEV